MLTFLVPGSDDRGMSEEEPKIILYANALGVLGYTCVATASSSVGYNLTDHYYSEISRAKYHRMSNHFGMNDFALEVGAICCVASVLLATNLFTKNNMMKWAGRIKKQPLPSNPGL
jgi:hypothetical protein